jgi:DNA polymerase III delta subunit
MIFLVHGDNAALSRKLIINQFNNKAFKAKKELNISEVTIPVLTEILLAQDLFGEAQFTILEVTGAKQPALEGVLPLLDKIPVQNILIIYSSKSLPKTNVLIKNATEKGIKIIENSLVPEGNIFKFIDLLINQNRNGAYKELDKLLKEGNDPFYLFSMIVYGMRNLTHATFKTEKFLQMKPYQQENLSNRTKKTTADNIKKLYKYIYDLDKKTKTGELQPEMMLTLSIEKMLNF